MSEQDPDGLDLPTCREWLPDDVSTFRGRDCGEPAEFLVWGHLFTKATKGPKCSEHLQARLDENGLPEYAVSQSAIFDLRAVRAAVAERDAEIERLRAGMLNVPEQIATALGGEIAALRIKAGRDAELVEVLRKARAELDLRYHEARAVLGAVAALRDEVRKQVSHGHATSAEAFADDLDAVLDPVPGAVEGAGDLEHRVEAVEALQRLGDGALAWAANEDAVHEDVGIVRAALDATPVAEHEQEADVAPAPVNDMDAAVEAFIEGWLSTQGSRADHVRAGLHATLPHLSLAPAPIADREDLARTLSVAFDRKWDDPDLRNADTWLYAADAILASPWLAAHVDAAVAEARGEVERLREHIADRLEYLRGVQRIALGYQHRYKNAEHQRDTARADRDRLVEVVRGLADEVEKQARHGHAITATAFADDLRALIAGTDDTTTRGTNQEDA